MSDKLMSIAYQTMCLFNEFDITTKRGIELAEDEWDSKGDRWLDVVMFLKEDIITEPPPADYKNYEKPQGI